MNTWIKKHLFPIILVGLFFLQFIFVNPIGEFATNDDWVHTDTIVHLVDTGEFRMLPFAGPTFYVPILYGAALVKLFGFSFSLLRLSTLVIMLALILFLYFFLLKKTASPQKSFLATLIFWFNPIVYNLSFTFMTDIPSLFLLLASIILYAKGFEEKKPVFIFLASLIALIGTFTRQTNILMLIAALIFALSEYKKVSFKQTFLCFGVPLLLGALIYLFLYKNALLPQSTNTHIIQGFGRWFGHVRWWSWYIPVYMGLFFLPLSFGFIWKEKKAWTNKYLWAIVLGSVFIALAIREFYHLQLPYVINMISLYGLGPITGVLRGTLQPIFSPKFWTLLTVASTASAAIFFFTLVKQYAKTALTRILMIFCGLSTATLLLFESFDRYVLPLFLALLIVFVITSKKISLNLSLICLVPFAVFSIMQTAFYLSYHKTVWSLADSAVETYHLETHRIDAGYEWDGWNGYWSSINAPHVAAKANDPWWIRGLFPNNTGDFVISSSLLAGYKEVGNRTVPGYNPNNTLYLLKKIQ